MIQWSNNDVRILSGTGTIYTADGMTIGSCTVGSSRHSKGGNMRGLYKAYIVTSLDEIIEVDPFLSYKDKAETKALLKSGLLTADNADDVDDFTVILQRLGDAPECDEDDDE